MELHTLDELDQLYRDAEACDREIFAEMRTNLLLVAGEHYSRRNSQFFQRLRDFKEISDQQRIRLTKNHVQKITKRYANRIMAAAPDVGFFPKNEKELSDKKSAELHHAVWLDAKDRYDLQEKKEEWCDELVEIGECATKIFWDPGAGEVQAYNQEVSAGGEPAVDENGQPKAGEPVFSGDFIFEEVQGFNLLRDPNCRNMKKSPYLIIRKMTDVKLLKKLYPEYEDKINPGNDTTVIVFDAQKGKYRRTDNEALVKEFYFRPCHRYPRGYFYIVTDSVILRSDELPGGIFPIVWEPYKKIATSARGVSPVRTMRPYQAEINRSASKIAEQQVTLGDDKILLQNGATISAGVSLPGVRSVYVSGAAPEVLPGRSGEQYVGYMTGQIEEMYNVMDEEDEEASAQTDAYMLLYKAASQKKKHSQAIRRFERFLINVSKTYEALAKIHLPEDRVIRAIGKHELINIKEFKNTNELCYEVKVTGQSDDVETKLGKQLFLTQVLQYVGGQLTRQDIGRLMRAAPYSDIDTAYKDFTLEYDTATNIILALDRGEQPVFSPYQPHEYIVKRLVDRMLESDFQYLGPEIAQGYMQRKQLHEEIMKQQIQEAQRLKDGFIPTGGAMVACDLYVTLDPKNPGKTQRVRVPYQAIDWLINQLKAQGQTLDQLEAANSGVVAEVAQQLAQGQQMPPATGPGPSQPGPVQ